MEVYSIGPSTIRIKGKQAALVVDPTKLIKAKVQADGVLFLGTSKEFDSSKVEEQRVVIQGPGEFELGGLKISGLRVKEDLLYELLVEGLKICVVQAKTLSTFDDKNEYHVVIINANAPIDSSRVAAMTPSVVILYGEQAGDGAKKLGKDSVTPVSKYQTTFEKLPPEMEIVVLG